jgi:hypothetical protein
MKLGDSIDTAYVIVDSTYISSTLEKRYGDKPDDWMIVNEMSVVQDGIRYSKIQVNVKGNTEIVWFRHPKGPTWFGNGK